MFDVGPQSAPVAAQPATAAPQTPQKAAQPAPITESVVKRSSSGIYTSKGMRVYLDYDKKLSKNEVRQAFRGTPAYHTYNTGRTFNIVADAAMWSGVGVTGFGILWVYVLGIDSYTYSYTDNNGNPHYIEEYWNGSPWIAVIGGVIIATGITFKIMAVSKVKKSVKMYNSYGVASYLDDNYTPELSFGVTGGGLGLTLTF